MYSFKRVRRWGRLAVCWALVRRLWVLRADRTALRLVVTAAGREGCVSDERWVWNVRCEVVDNEKGYGIVWEDGDGDGMGYQSVSNYQLIWQPDHLTNCQDHALGYYPETPSLAHQGRKLVASTGRGLVEGQQ
jgi:hypothetical protein